MQVAIVCDSPDAVVVHKPTWVADGFRAAGHDVRFAHGIAEVKAADAQCDLLVLDHKACGCNHVDLAIAAENRRAVWVQWWRDLVAFDPALPLARQPYMQTFRRLMRAVDVCFVKERGLIAEYQALGINARWLDQACPENMPECVPAREPQWDVFVAGATGYRERIADVRALTGGKLRVLWAAMPGSDTLPPDVDPHPWTLPHELPYVMAYCATALNVDWRNDLDGFSSDRVYLVAGAGGCLVRRWAPGMASLPSFHYSDHDSLLRLVRGLAADYELRVETGRLARRAVMQAHTYTHRVQELLEHVPCCVG